jgi:hypothetical protein
MILWGESVLFLALGALIIVGNPLGILRTAWTKKKFSLIPFVGGISGMIGCLVCPDERVNAVWWLPLVLDITISLFGPLMLLSLLFPRFFYKSQTDTKA